MGKRLLIFAIIFLSLLAFTIWHAQPPFRLQRKLLAKLPYEPLITDLDDDGHPEVTGISRGKLLWVRFPFDKPSTLRFENCWAIQMREQRCQFVPKALPVLMVDRRLRLLRWKDGKAKLEPLPNLPDVPMEEEDACIERGESTETVFLRVYRGDDCWLFTLTPKGEWQFASRFTSKAIRFRKFAPWYIADLADLDRDGFWDALCLNDADIDAWVSWGGRGEETDLGGWLLSGYPRIIDLDGDGWAEIVMADKDGRLKIWRFDRRERRLKVIATSPSLSAAFSLQLFDLDEDGRKEIAVTDVGRDCWVFQWRDEKLKMWKGKTTRSQSYKGQGKFCDRLALYGDRLRLVYFFSPRIWLEGRKLRWQFWEWETVNSSVFCFLPKGGKALFPSNWRIQEAPFRLEFADDIDRDGSDEVIGYDFRWRCWRLYRAEMTKAGELRWRDVLLGRDEPKAFAMLVDGKRRGLVVGWEDGRLELLTMESRR